MYNAMLTEGAKLFPPVRTMQQDTPERLRETKKYFRRRGERDFTDEGVGRHARE